MPIVLLVIILIAGPFLAPLTACCRGSIRIVLCSVSVWAALLQKGTIPLVMTYLLTMTTPPSSLRSHGITTSRRSISRIRCVGGGDRLLHPLWTFGSIMSLLLAVEALNVGDIVMIVHRLSCRGVAGRVGCCRIGAINPLEVVASLERSESQVWRYT